VGQVRDAKIHSPHGSTHEAIAASCMLLGGGRRSHWAPGVFTRMAIAPYAALVLQWGTVGAALIVAYFTPTTGVSGM
jgi:hypothetical protein